MGMTSAKFEAERKKAKRKQVLCAWGLCSPFIIIFVLFSLIPFVLGFAFSFMRYNPYATDGNSFYGFQNYINLFNFDMGVSKEFWNSFSTMLLFCLVAVPCLIVIPLVLAYFINMEPPGYKIYRAILYLPSVLSISVVGIIFSCMFQGDEYGLINSWLGTDIEWLSGEPFKGDTLRWVVILLVSIWWQTGTNFIILSAALRNVPKSLYEACEMDGGSRWQLIRRVTLPNIRASVNLCLFTTLIGYWNLYGQVTVLYDSSNQNISVSPMMFIQKYLSGVTFASQTGYICAAAIVFGLFVMIFSLIQQGVTKDRKRSAKRTLAYQAYAENKVMLGSQSAENGGQSEGENV